MPSAADFFALDLRVGTILRAEPFPEMRKPSYRLAIDFGELGVKRSSAQLTTLYTPGALVGRQVVAAVNIGERRLAAGFVSEVLVLGAMPTATEVVLLAVDRPVANGTRIG